MWSRRRTKICGSYAQDPDSDWVILYLGKEVGRITRQNNPLNGAKPWTWSSWTLPAEKGRVDTLEEAQEEVRGAVMRILRSSA